jgi:hypothetical protein
MEKNVVKRFVDTFYEGLRRSERACFFLSRTAGKEQGPVENAL